MKNLCIYFFLSLCPLIMIAQDVSQNFVMERVYLDSLCQGRVTTVSYYDGLGYGNETVSVSANGEKLRTLYLTAMPNLMVPVGETHELSVSETLCRDTVEYMLGGTLILNNGRIDKFLFDGGYFKGMRFTDSCDFFSVYFYNRDHLGNNRETLDGEGNVVQVTNYYPFGAPFCDDASSKGTGVQQYKYNGKELDMTHGLNTYDYGARQYYAPLATWDRMDEMAEEYYWMTPYAYCLNNPVRSIDPDGSTVIIVYQQYGTEHEYIMKGKWDEILHAPRNQFVHDVISAHSYLKSHGASEMFDKMIASNKNVYIRQTNGVSHPDYNNRYTNLFWDPHSGLEVGNNKYQSPATQLEHEFTHIVNNYKSAHDRRIRSEANDKQYENKEERLVITGHEKDITKKLGESRRYNHSGKLYRTKGPTSIEEDNPEKKTKDTTNHIDYDKIINNSLNNKTDNLRVTRIW